MPLIDITSNQHGTIGIWELTEKADELLKVCKLSTADQKRLQELKVEKRKKEFLAARILLQSILPECPEIVYHNESGKPSLPNTNLNISITHSAELAAVFLSNNKVGIDIEQLNRNIDKVVNRFANPSEKKFIEESRDPQLLKILLWSAKESIFKCCGNQGIQFNTQINIRPFDFASHSAFSGSLTDSSNTYNYNLFFRIIKNNMLVYCVQQ